MAGLLISIAVAILICVLCYKLVPDRTLAFILALIGVLACVGGYIGLGGKIAHGSPVPAEIHHGANH